jgi:holo-[acyl-carrier protein] synthase
VIRGLGVDIVEIDRMTLALERHPRLKERCFSEAERAYCEARSRPAVHYALRFAAKEAVLKALGTGFSGMRFRDVEVSRDDSGRPTPLLHGRAAEVAAAAGIVELHLSLSYTHATAVASAVAIAGEKAAAVPEQLTPQEQVAAMFKASRRLLDELDPHAEGTSGGDGESGGTAAAAPEADPSPGRATDGESRLV